MKRWWMLAAIVLTLAMAGTVLAQGDTSIAYGETVEGEVTDSQFEVPYVFTGSEGDVIHARMVVDDSGEFYEPSLILLDADNSVVASYDGWYEATLLAALPADGEYTLLASRVGGRTGTDTGNFTLTLDLLSGIRVGEPVEGEMTNQDVVLYAVPADAPFTLEFERVSGDFAPELTINIMGEFGEFEVIGTAYGQTVRKLTLEVEPDPERAVDFYVIQLAQSQWDWNFDLASAQYRLTFTQ